MEEIRDTIGKQGKIAGACTNPDCLQGKIDEGSKTMAIKLLKPLVQKHKSMQNQYLSDPSFLMASSRSGKSGSWREDEVTQFRERLQKLEQDIIKGGNEFMIDLKSLGFKPVFSKE